MTTLPPAETRPTFWRAAGVSAGLSVLFLLVYNTTNWLASVRPDVPSFYFEWERHIPFVPAMIVPYMSIDLFFVAAPFVCATRQELRILAWRVVTAILVAGIFFALMPLKFSFDRPVGEGWVGEFFNKFREIDKPFNQFPSLHIALRTILADVYARHTRRYLRWASNGWFVLIGLSTLLTHQHHVIDVVGGFALGFVCLYVVGEPPWRRPVVANWLGVKLYGAAAALLLAAAVLTWRWCGWVLLWPAAAVGILAAGYAGLGPGLFRKHGGRIPVAAKVVLWPVLHGQWLSLRHYARRSNAWDAVSPGLWIGRTLSDAEAARAVDAGVRAVLDLTGELSEARPFLDDSRVTYLNLPVLDLTAPPDVVLREATAFIARERAAGHTVYVHCKAGYSRSAAVVAAHLLRTGAARTGDEALATIRAVRPGIIVRPEAVAAVERFAGEAAGAGDLAPVA